MVKLKRRQVATELDNSLILYCVHQIPEIQNTVISCKAVMAEYSDVVSTDNIILHNMLITPKIDYDHCNPNEKKYEFGPTLERSSGQILVTECYQEYDGQSEYDIQYTTSPGYRIQITKKYAREQIYAFRYHTFVHLSPLLIYSGYLLSYFHYRYIHYYDLQNCFLILQYK